MRCTVCWMLCGVFTLPFSLSLSLSLTSSTSVVRSRSATLGLATALLLRWNGAPTCSGPFVDLIRQLLDHLHLSLHLCILHDVLITPFREWNLLCFLSFLQRLCVVVFWHCISAGTSTFMSMYCCCETSMICSTFWLVLLMHCTSGQLERFLHLVDMVVYCTWISFLCTLKLGTLGSARSHDSVL